MSSHPTAFDLRALDGSALDAAALEGRAVLVVNTASGCGLAPQFAGLEALHRRYADQGFSVLGVPCRQFGGQEPLAGEELANHCATTYDTTFPMTERLEVNGRRRHPLYQQLTDAPDAEGQAGEVAWNFEKFLVAPSGEVVARFRPTVAPESDEVVSAIEQVIA